jgi:predicted adenine nucleotide alpha hydrolase (AANH) superfamily ATPase
MKQVAEESPRMIALAVPGGATDVLLHACCAPCSGAILECMLANGLHPTVFYFNPNIYPRTEYERRKAESIRYAESLHVPFVDGDYDHAGWLRQVQGLEAEPERGSRCLACFKGRLSVTARYADEHEFTVFTTTLAASRWKNLHQINDAGCQAAALFPGLTFWEQNWRKGGLSDRRNELIKQYRFYNQTYCGCEYSVEGSKTNGESTFKSLKTLSPI